MFANKIALETLVKSDTQASDSEKRMILSLLEGKSVPQDDIAGRREQLLASAVVSITDAAWLLGLDSCRPIYAALRNNVLEGYYGGRQRARATGIKTESIIRSLDRGRSLKYRR